MKFKRIEFQSRFADIMEASYPGDFSTALHEFGVNMKKWIFVHNDPDGLTPDTAVDTLGGLSSEHPEIEIQTYAFNEIWDIVEKLDIGKIVSLFGYAPTDESLKTLQLVSIIPVLRFIEGREVPSEVPVDPPDPQKLEYNLFGPEVRDMLKSGRRKERLVENYIDSVLNPEYGESIAVAFRKKYESLKAIRLMRANEIFDDLRIFAGGDHGTIHATSGGIQSCPSGCGRFAKTL